MSKSVRVTSDTSTDILLVDELFEEGEDSLDEKRASSTNSETTESGNSNGPKFLAGMAIRANGSISLVREEELESLSAESFITSHKLHLLSGWVKLPRKPSKGAEGVLTPPFIGNLGSLPSIAPVSSG